MNKVRVLAALLIAETILLITIFVARFHVIVNTPPTTVTLNPLKMALEYESPDEKFAELVREYPGWISYRSDNKGDSLHWQILADCALVKRTNYVRILIANGANVEDAERSLREVGAIDAIGLLHGVQSEKNAKPSQGIIQ